MKARAPLQDDEVPRNTTIPWIRILIEGGAIVVSILLAFGIDAWWADRQAAEEEQAALVRMRDDFVATRAGLANTIHVIEETRDRFSRFRSVPPAAVQATPTDSVALIMTALVNAITFDPVSGTLDALVSGGRLDAVGSVVLRETLASWLRNVEDMKENEADVRSGALRVLQAMESHGGPFHNSISLTSEDDLAVLPMAGPATLVEMRSDEALMGAARSFHYSRTLYLRELKRIEPVLDSVLTLIEESLTREH